MMTRAEAIDLFHSPDLIGIGMAADAVRRKLHPDGIVSYIIDRNINYTNFCTEYCSFCAFYRPLGHAEGYILPNEVIYQKIQETVDLGGTGILMQGGLHPEAPIGVGPEVLHVPDPRAVPHRHGCGGEVVREGDLAEGRDQHPGMAVAGEQDPWPVAVVHVAPRSEYVDTTIHWQGAET